MSRASDTARDHAIATSRKTLHLFDRHWTWLDTQPAGASASLRALIDEARKDKDGRYRAAQCREACYFTMRDKAGDRPQFEEAVRALFHGDAPALQRHMASWPLDIRMDIATLLRPVWGSDADATP